MLSLEIEYFVLIYLSLYVFFIFKHRGVKKVHNNLEGPINKLPDDIIVSILSQLKLRDAARTSALSRRWRNMWKYTTGILDFDNSDLMHDMAYKNGQKCSIKTERDKFVAWVNLVLKLHQVSTLDEFKVCFDLDGGSVINSWIHFALKKRVKRLELDFTSTWGRRDLNYILTPQILCSSNLDSLKVLSLSSVEVTGEVLGHVLSSCPFLEVLHVEASTSLVELKVPNSLRKLNCLEVISCMSMKYLEVFAVNLVSFSYYGPMICLFFERVPCLLEAYFGGQYSHFLVNNIHQFSSYINKLQSLALDLSWFLIFMDWVVTDSDFAWHFEFPKFRKLKRLELSLWDSNVDSCVRCCALLLKASPFLHRFVLKMKGVLSYGDEEESSDTDQDVFQGGKGKRKARHQHRHLKVVEFVGFRGSSSYVKLVLRVLKQVKSPEKIIIVPKPNSHHREEVERAFDAAQMLEKSLPPGTQLVITEPKDRGRYFSEFGASKMCH